MKSSSDPGPQAPRIDDADSAARWNKIDRKEIKHTTKSLAVALRRHSQALLKADRDDDVEGLEQLNEDVTWAFISYMYAQYNYSGIACHLIDALANADDCERPPGPEPDEYIDEVATDHSEALRLSVRTRSEWKIDRPDAVIKAAQDHLKDQSGMKAREARKLASGDWGSVLSVFIDHPMDWTRLLGVTGLRGEFYDVRAYVTEPRTEAETDTFWVRPAEGTLISQTTGTPG